MVTETVCVNRPLETNHQFSENNSLTFTEVVERGVEEVSMFLAPLGPLVRYLDPTLLLPLPVVPGRRILLRVLLVSVAQRPVFNLHQDRCVYHVRLKHGDRVSSLPGCSLSAYGKHGDRVSSLLRV